MFNKKYFVGLLFVSVFVLSGLVAFAQTNSISGKVQLKADGGARTPAVGVQIDCYDLTIFTQEGSKATCDSTKTNESGEFTVTGLSPEGKYILAASADGIGPRITLPEKAGKTDEIITVIKGNGEVLTKNEVWQAYAFSKNSAGGFSSDQKAAQAQYEKRLAELSASNDKIKASNTKIKEFLDAGNKAYAAENYDLAITKYDEGINLAPDFIGSAPVFYNNKAAALKNRAVKRFNSAIGTKDAATIKQGKVDAKKDLVGVIDAAYKSYVILDKAKPTEVSDKANHKKNIFNAVDYARDATRIMVQIDLVDEERAGNVKTLLSKYMELQSDKVKKGKAQSSIGSYLMKSGDYTSAVVEFKKALEYSKRDPDVLAGLGLSLYTASFDTDSKTQRQEGLNYMSAFLKVAPKNHRMRSGILGAVDDLIKNQKLKPQKIK